MIFLVCQSIVYYCTIKCILFYIEVPCGALLGAFGERGFPLTSISAGTPGVSSDVACLKLFSTNYSQQVILNKLFSTNYSQQVILNKLFSTNYSQQIILNKLFLFKSITG